MNNHRRRKNHKHKHRRLRDKENRQVEVDVENKSELMKSTFVTDNDKQETLAVRLPVVIAETTININLENTINFTRDVISIIGIRRKAIIKRCKLISQINRLFLDGVVVKSIEYSEETKHNSSRLEGKAKNLTIKIPFECAVGIEYIHPPITCEEFYEGDKIIRMSENEKSFVDRQQEIDDIYCELVGTEFKELNVKDKIKLINEAKKMSTFKQIKQSMSMDIKVRLLQKQMIFIKKG